MFNNIKKQMFKNKVSQILNMKPELLANQKCIKLRSGVNDFKLGDIVWSGNNDDIDFVDKLTKVATLFLFTYPDGREYSLIVPLATLELSKTMTPYDVLRFGEDKRSVMPQDFDKYTMFKLVRDSYRMEFLCDVINTLCTFMSDSPRGTSMRIRTTKYTMIADDVTHESLYFMSFGGHQVNMCSFILNRSKTACYDIENNLTKLDLTSNSTKIKIINREE
ncbi:MAG: hypothetical protein ACRC92_26420 [Peptostreptococcaceae bacterium]